MDVKLTEKKTTMLHKKSRPCKNYNKESGESYNSCCTTMIWSLLTSKINCTVPGMLMGSLLFIFINQKEVFIQTYYLRSNNFIMKV